MKRISTNVKWRFRSKWRNGEKGLDPENTSSILNTVINKINNKFENECLDEAVRLLNARPIS